jgi:hypothetical protein
MHHGPFLYGASSAGEQIRVHDATRAYQIGHRAHYRTIAGRLRPHELHREQEGLHFLRHYGIQTFVAVPAEHLRVLSQQLSGFVDYWVAGSQEFTVLTTPNYSSLIHMQHSSPLIIVDPTEGDIRERLRAIEAAQQEGVNIRGYFSGPISSEVHESEIVLRAIIQQAQSVVP